MAAAEENLNIEAFEALKLAECPVCFEIFCPPVFQCANGHLICSSCLDGVKICPTCREEMPEKRIRSLIAESLVSLKCQNFKWGCKVTLTRKDKRDHELLCQYSSRDYCCRMEFNKLGIECDKIVSKLNLPSHMKDEHKLTVIENGEAGISQEIDVDTLNWERKWRPVLFTAFDDFFFLDCEITSPSGSSGATISLKCISAGSVSNAQQFSVTMSIIPSDKGVSLKWKGKVISIDQLEDKDLNYFYLTMNTLRELTINKKLDKLDWIMNVVIQRNNFNTCVENPIPPVIRMTYVVPSIFQIIEGAFQRVSGNRWWTGSTIEAEIAYSREGSLWTRKAKNCFQYSFTLGEEVTFQFGISEYKSTIIIESNKLIHRVKRYVNEMVKLDLTEVEEFSNNKMLSTDTWCGTSRTAVYRKING